VESQVGPLRIRNAAGARPRICSCACLADPTGGPSRKSRSRHDLDDEFISNRDRPDRQRTWTGLGHLAAVAAPSSTRNRMPFFYNATAERHWPPLWLEEARIEMRAPFFNARILSTWQGLKGRGARTSAKEESSLVV